MKKLIVLICASLLFTVTNECLGGMFSCALCNYKCPPQYEVQKRCPYCGHSSIDNDDPLIIKTLQLKDALINPKITIHEKKEILDNFSAIDDPRIIYILRITCDANFKSSTRTDVDIKNLLIGSIEMLMRKKGFSYAKVSANSRIREIPSLDGKIVKTAGPAGIYCFVAEHKNGWYKIPLPPWQLNWVNGKCVRILDYRVSTSKK